MAKILITGAHGFIGRHLAKRLAGQGHHVSGLGHGVWNKEEACRWGVVDWINGDVQSANLRELQARHEPEFVFHLAGGSSVGAAIANPREDFMRTVKSTVELLDWIRLDLPKVRLIAVSSAAIYGNGISGLISESTKGVPYSPYGYHKSIMESLCHSYAASFGLDYTIARLFSVYGSGLKKQLLWDICIRLAADNLPILLDGTGNEVRDWTHINDVVVALEQIAFDWDQVMLHQTINVGTGVGTPVKNIAHTLIQSWEEISANSNQNTIDFTGISRKGDPFSLVADPTILSSMGFTWQVSLDEGIKSFVDWFRFSTNS